MTDTLPPLPTREIAGYVRHDDVSERVMLGHSDDSMRAYATAVRDAAVAAERTDAERYRWLRNFGNFARVDAMLDTTEFNTLDAAVDVAMAREPIRCDNCGKTIAEHDCMLRCYAARATAPAEKE